MVTEDYRPRRARKRQKVTHDDLMIVVDYIMDAWVKETPGMFSQDDTAVARERILQFMHDCHIQTIDDYRELLIKY